MYASNFWKFVRLLAFAATNQQNGGQLKLTIHDLYMILI